MLTASFKSCMFNTNIFFHHGSIANLFNTFLLISYEYYRVLTIQLSLPQWQCRTIPMDSNIINCIRHEVVDL